MDGYKDGVMTAVYLPTVVADYEAKVDTFPHRYGCGGIDGVTFRPAFGRHDGKMYLTAAYGVYSDKKRKDNDYNMMFLRQQQNYFNDLLRVRKHVFLNEVYDALGIPRSQAGAVVGWMISEENDNFIDFGIFDGDKPRSRDFVNGYENSILLDFNVDGVIYNLFTKEKA